MAGPRRGPPLTRRRTVEGGASDLPLRGLIENANLDLHRVGRDAQPSAVRQCGGCLQACARPGGGGRDVASTSCVGAGLWREVWAPVRVREGGRRASGHSLRPGRKARFEQTTRIG